MFINVTREDDLFVYHCNGENDNILLSNLISKIQSNGFNRFTVEVIGHFGTTGFLAVSNANKKKITIDFSKCDNIEINSGFLNVTNVRIIGLHLSIYGGSGFHAITGTNSTFENCVVDGSFVSGDARVFNLSNCKMIECECDVVNSGGSIYGVYGDSCLITECDIKVKSSTASAYGIEVTKSFVSNSRFTGQTDSSETTVSGNGGIGGGYFSNCQFIGIGALKGQGFFIRGGAWITMNNCVARGYTKNASSGWGTGIGGQVNEATTISLLGINCNEEVLSGYSQSKSFELLNGYGVYSGTFFTAVNVASTITSLGAFNRNRS